jgi:hypothetical protein
MNHQARMIAAALLLAATARGQALVVPQGAIPVIDSVLSPGEWADAAMSSFTIFSNDGNNTPMGTDTVWAKRNGDTLYVAVRNCAAVAGNCALLFDRAFERAGAPQPDDCKLLVSNPPFDTGEFAGNGSGWTAQAVTGWRSQHAKKSGWPAEFAISYAKLGLGPGADTIGFSVGISGFTSGRWPEASANENQPSSWGRMVPVGSWAGVATAPRDEKPANFILRAYPNPTAGRFMFRFQLPVAADVRLAVYNIDGQFIKMSDEGRKPAGCHSVNWDLSQRPAGVYFCRLRAGAFESTRRLVVVK